jgi:hypothetical protein
MFGDLSHHLLEDSNIMFHSLMIVANLFGSIFSKISLMYLKKFMIFSSWLCASSTRGFLLLKPTGATSIKSSRHSSSARALHITSRALKRTSKMARPSANTNI